MVHISFRPLLREQGNKPFLILVKWMNTRHVEVAFRRKDCLTDACKISFDSNI